MNWFFSPQLPGQVETEVTQRDQFSNDEVQLSETIVRESIQNSLDAASDDSSHVTVKFRWLDESDGFDTDFLKKIFNGQLDHAKAAGLNLDSVDLESPRALVIEDFGTKGLTGDVSKKDDDNFSDFWRRHGKSHKTGKSRGRWGLGKLVYSTTSQLGVFFGATLRAGDPELHVMGQTVLNLRKVDGKEYPPHGFFADIEGEDLYSQIPVPLKDKDLVNQFVDQFSLERLESPGLSVMIPYPNPEFSLEPMIGVAIVNYFFPVLTGQLTLVFNGIEINKDNIREMAHKYAQKRLTDVDTLFDFIEEVRDVGADSRLTLRPSWADDEKLDEDDFEVEDLNVIREKFSNSELISLCLPVVIKKKDGIKVDASFAVHIKRPKDLTRGLDLYVRGGLTLPGESKFRERKALGAMIAEDEAICSFLGDAENAAHTQWVASAEKLHKNYRSPGKVVKMIKNSVVQLYDLLAEEMEEVDEEALRSFFWMDQEEGMKPRKKQKKTPVVIPKPPEPRKKDFHITETSGGFTITSTSDIDRGDLPKSIRVDVAYDVSSGNPFKKYSPHDFRLGKKAGIEIDMTTQTGKIISAKENVIRVEVVDVPFKLALSGFDVNRDLKIRLVKEG